MWVLAASSIDVCCFVSTVGGLYGPLSLEYVVSINFKLSWAVRVSMGELLWADENRIDRASQRMLRGLAESEVLNTTELRHRTDLSQNAQVSHRLENHLIPAGLVDEIEREARPGGTKDVRRFRLTTDGHEWVAERSEELDEVVTIEEVRAAAREARSDASSAKDSVQSYRRKVYQLKCQVDEVGEDIEELEEWKENQVMTTDMMWARYKETLREDQICDVVDERLNEALESVAEHAEVQEMNGRIAELESVVGDLESELGVMREKLGVLEEELATVRKESERGFWDRLLSR